MAVVRIEPEFHETTNGFRQVGKPRLRRPPFVDALNPRLARHKLHARLVLFLDDLRRHANLGAGFLSAYHSSLPIAKSLLMSLSHYGITCKTNVQSQTDWSKRMSEQQTPRSAVAETAAFDPSKPFTTRDGNVVKAFASYDTGELQGVVEGLPRVWLPDGRHVNGRRELDLINTPTPTVPPTPAVDMGAKLTFAEAIDIVCGSSRLHLGDDAYSQGLDTGARKQVEASVTALESAAARTPAGDMAGEDDAAQAARRWIEDYAIRTEPYTRSCGDHPMMMTLPQAFEAFAVAREGARREPALRSVVRQEFVPS